MGIVHRIERLLPQTRSSVRSHVHRVLAQYALGHNHGPISTKALFLKTADELVRAGVIERPQFLGGSGAGGQKFASMIRGRQPQVFPDYGIPCEIAELIRQTLWKLYIQGVLSPAPKRNPLEDMGAPPKHQDFWLSLDCVMITPYGVRVLVDTTNQIQVHDPDGYLANFWDASPAPDLEMMRYLSECIAVFGHGHLLASVVLLAIASERLLDVLAENLRDALGAPRGIDWFRSKYSNQRDLSKRFKALSGTLLGEFGQELNQHKLKQAFQGVVTLTYEQIRLARNDVAHLADRRFTWNEVSGFLHQFVQYFGYINRIIVFLGSNPKGS